METTVDTLCTNMLSDKEQLRDISSIGLKTVISELPPTSTGKMSVPVCLTETTGIATFGKQRKRGSSEPGSYRFLMHLLEES